LSKTLAPIILASQSPRRRELLKTLTDYFETITSEAKEIINLKKPPIENAKDLAEKKMEWVAKVNPGRFIIAADTVVAFNSIVLGKPKDENDAIRILRLLSSHSHQVITGIAAKGPGVDRFIEAGVSTVKFKILADDQIRDYVLTGEPMDKAGAYAIQGKGSELIDFYEGSYSNIVGLPLEIVKPLLINTGYLIR